MNKEQKEAIFSNEQKIIVCSGPGSGKTYTLMEAVKEYTKNNTNTNTIVVTFTNAAADQLKEKLSTDLFFIGTIHSFSLKLIYQLGEMYNFTPNILKQEQIEAIIYKLLKEDSSKFSLKNLKDIIFYITNKDKYREIHNDIIPKYMIDIDNDYNKFKKSVNAYDYTDAPQYLKELLLYYKYPIVFDGIFIDEAQDLSEEQYEIFSILQANKKFIIGDPDQSIYIFRGASKEIFNKFEKNGYIRYDLIYNYRSLQSIIDNAKSNQISARGTGGLVDYDNPYKLLNFNPVILCRTNMEVALLQKYYKNVRTIHSSKGLEWDNVIVVDFIKNNEEDENIMFVALTRARDRIGIYTFQQLERALQLWKINE